jgi:hypothetical protein
MEDIDIKSRLYVYNISGQTIFIDLEKPESIEIIKNNYE